MATTNNVLYRNVSKIGEGGFGSVYKATDPTGTTVAIKVNTYIPAGRKEARFLQEFIHAQQSLKVRDFREFLLPNSKPAIEPVTDYIPALPLSETYHNY